MIIVTHRITKARYASTVFDGVGAKQSGARWNSPGQPVVYASGHLSLAAMELLVHLDKAALLLSYVRATLAIDDKQIELASYLTLPKTLSPQTPLQITQAVGDAWLAARQSLALRVPSVVVPGEHNFLINPVHPAFQLIGVGAVEPFTFDARLSR